MMKIEKIWVTDDAVWIMTEDGRAAFERFADYPILQNASDMERSNYVADAFGIHWPELDEDLCYDGFFREKEKPYLYSIFMSHPELNASAVARRLGMSQSLFAQYISGTKTPSAERMNQILETIRTIGEELSRI
jgi:hypothetical protein